MPSKNKDITSKICDTKEGLHFSIRQANHEDIDALIEVCKKNFTDTIVWQVPRYFLRHRWENILSSGAAETWICTANTKIVGLANLIFDADTYMQETRHINGGTFKKLCFSLMRPRTALLTMINKIHIFTSISKKNRAVIQDKSISKKFTWIEPIAVLPNMHRKGIATKLLEHCRNRTLQLKMSGIKLLVKPRNIAAIRLYQKVGFTCTGYNTSADIYALILKEDATDEIQKR